MIDIEDPRILALIERMADAIEAAGGEPWNAALTHVTWDRESGKVTARFEVEAGTHEFEADETDVLESLEQVAKEMEAIAQ